MFFSWFLLGLLVNVPLRSVTALQTYELIAHRHIATTTCVDSRIRQIKRNRALEKAETSNLIAKTKLVSSPNGKASLEEVRVFAHDKRALLEYFNTLCDDKYASKGHLPKIDDGRTEAVLSSLHSYAEHPEVPPFDVALVAGSKLSHNRVALTFFADGYIQSEKANFFEDVRFLVNEISGNQTYHTVAPLMNFWAAFTPSRESGVGVNGQPKDTPFGLYRDGTELRALYYAHPEVARASCDSLGDKCDFPVLLGNDKLYGGLGGEFTTITASLINGPRVLRHELGHSIINVGEEYDGGFAYFGVNSAPNLSDPLPWGHWLADPKDSSRAERSVMPMQAYPWTLLNSSDPWSIVFDSAGTYSRHLARFSLSGLPESADLTVLFDGEDIDWKAKEGLGVDRWHYDIYRDQSLAPGSHNISFQLNSPELEGTAQLCSVEILEFGSPQEFNATTGYYGAFPTFSDKNETTYRPTNEDCLMRITNEPNFCKVCIEGLWLSLLEGVDLIEDFNTTCMKNSSSDSWTRQLTVSLVPLADPSEPRGVYSVEWRKDGNLLTDFSNKTVILLDDDKALGKFEVSVQFATPEVRLDPTGLLKSRHEVMISSLCSDISV